MFDGHLRRGVDSAVKPIGVGLKRAGVSADHLTAAGLLLSVATAVVIGNGYLNLGLVLLIASAVPDLLDGAVAKAAGTDSPRGAFFDSTADRLTDAFVLGGVAWYVQGEYGGHMAMLPFALLGASTLISYERAKAESLGFEARGGLMERAERVIVLCFGLLFDSLLIAVLWVMLALTAFTAVTRFVKVWRQASGGMVAPPRRSATRRRRQARTERIERRRQARANRLRRPPQR